MVPRLILRYTTTTTFCYLNFLEIIIMIYHIRNTLRALARKVYTMVNTPCEIDSSNVTKRIRLMSVSNRNTKESIPNKETTRPRFQPSKKRIRLTNLPKHHNSHAELNFQILVTLVIVCVMCLAGTIQPPVTHRRALFANQPATALNEKGFYLLGQFNTRGSKKCEWYKHNKDRSYFYKRGNDSKHGYNHIGTLLLCTRKGYWSNQVPKYTDDNRIEIFKDSGLSSRYQEDSKLTCVERTQHGTAKWVRIKTNIGRASHEIEIRDGKGYSNSSDKVNFFHRYFSDVLERPRMGVCGRGVVANPHTNQKICRNCNPKESTYNPNGYGDYVVCTWECYRTSLGV